MSRSVADRHAPLEPHPIEEARGFAVTATAPFVVRKKNLKKSMYPHPKLFVCYFWGIAAWFCARS